MNETVLNTTLNEIVTELKRRNQIAEAFYRLLEEEITDLTELLSETHRGDE